MTRPHMACAHHQDSLPGAAGNVFKALVNVIEMPLRVFGSPNRVLAITPLPLPLSYRANFDTLRGSARVLCRKRHVRARRQAAGREGWYRSNRTMRCEPHNRLHSTRSAMSLKTSVPAPAHPQSTGQTPLDESVARGEWALSWAGDEAVLYKVKVNVIDVPLRTFGVANGVHPRAPLRDAPFIAGRPLTRCEPALCRRPPDMPS